MSACASHMSVPLMHPFNNPAVVGTRARWICKSPTVDDAPIAREGGPLVEHLFTSAASQHKPGLAQGCVLEIGSAIDLVHQGLAIRCRGYAPGIEAGGDQQPGSAVARDEQVPKLTKASIFSREFLGRIVEGKAEAVIVVGEPGIPRLPAPRTIGGPA